MTAGVLADTHIVLWVRLAPQRLTPDEVSALDNANSRYVSAASLWEMAILVGLGRITGDLRLFEVPAGFDPLPIRSEHCRALAGLPQRHRDPFDRMLVAQARSENLALLTRDRAIHRYGADGVQIVGFDAGTAGC